MKRTLTRLVAHGVLVGGALLLTANIYAQDGSGNIRVQVNVDGTDFVVPLAVAQDGKLLGINQDGKLTAWNFIGQMQIGGPDGGLLTSLNVVADPDPFLGYAIGITDIGAPSVFAFTFGTPIVPTSPPGTFSSSYSGSLTDGGDGAISITPVAPGVPVDGDGVPEVHVVNDGFPLTNDGHDLGPAAAFAGEVGETFVHGPFNELLQPMIGPGPWTWLQVNVTFEGSGGNDFYGLTGRAEKVETPAVPEAASTLLLTLAGLASCALSRRSGLFTR
jgi:hypothetical protein